MESKFELSATEIEGLKRLNNEINEEITKKIIVNAVKQLVVKGPAIAARTDIYESPLSAEIKQADYAVCVVLVLSAKHSIDMITLREILNAYKIDNRTIDQLVESYEKFKDEIHSRLSKIGNSHGLDELTNVSVEVQQQNSSNDLIYKINLHSFDHEEGKNRLINEIFCNQEELQSLIYKLKDIERHCENLSKI